MNVKLIAKTQGVGELKDKSLGEIMAYAARVSNPDNQNNHLTSSKLLTYCLKHGHVSVFETASLTMEITTSRGIAAQILRHRSFTFQEFCVAGDTEIYFDLPNYFKSGQRRLYKKTIAQLYNSFSKNPDLIKNMNLRVYNQTTKLFDHAKIKEVFKTGYKPLYEITLENGKKIKATKEHKFLTKEGFQTMEEALGIQLLNNKAYLTKDSLFATNGVYCHQDKDWLKAQKEKSILDKTGLPGIAAEAKVSYNTIRKWLRIHNLQFSKLEVASYTSAWNKGKYGYSLPPHTKETKLKMKNSAKKGAESNLWKGGVDRDWRLEISDEINKDRNLYLTKANFKCTLCSGSKELQLHHIIPVYKNKELALEPSNIQVLCKKCHMEHHKLVGDYSVSGSGTKLIPRYSKVIKINYIGEDLTYDLETDHSDHNYIANGLVVHNSQRYSAASTFELYPARSQDAKNRQNSIDNMDEETKQWFEKVQENVWDVSFAAYEQALDKNIAKEQARFLLPLNTQTTLYMTGNVRSWIHYCEQRTKEGVQQEHKDIAELCKSILLNEVPELKDYFNV